MAKIKKVVEPTFGIKSLALQSTDMQILHPLTKEGLVNAALGKPICLNLVSQDSQIFSEIQASTLSKIKTNYEKTKVMPTTKETRQATYELFIGLVVGWNEAAELFFKDELGDDCKYSNDNAMKIMSKPEYFWLVKQIEDFIADRSHFFPKQ